MNAKRSEARNWGYWWHRGVLATVLLFLVTPVLATLLYSVSTRWGATMLPDGLTLHWYLDLWQAPRFQAVFLRSVLLILASLALSALVVVPAVFLVVYRFPAMHGLMNAAILLPFAVPPVVSSVGLLQLYSDGPLPMIGTPWVLVGCYFVIALPFLYRALSDRLRSMDLHALLDAAHLLGAETPQAFWHIVLPNLRPALLAALFVSFSTLLSEFVLANLLVGTRFETLQIYLYNMRTESGHFTSAIVMSYFLFTLGLTWLALRLSRQR